MSERRTFTAPIEQARGGGAYVIVPFDVEAAFGKKRVPVVASIDGVEYHGSLVRMGGGHHVLGVLKSIRDSIGKQPGDLVEITIAEETAPRTIEPPEDLRRALATAPEAAAFFETLAYSHRREYVRWIEEARREQTRADRVARTVALLAAGTRSR